MFDDLAAATEFFAQFGLVLHVQATVEGRWVDRVVGLEGVRADIAMMQTPDGNVRLELTRFDGDRTRYSSPAELERYQGKYRLCSVRGPEDIIIEMAEKIG